MPDPSTLWSLVNSGGIVAFAVIGVVAIVRGWVVPGYLYEREVKRNEKLSDQVDLNTKTLDRLTDEVRARERVGG